MKARSWLFLPSSAILADAVNLAVGVTLVREPRQIVSGILAHGILAFVFGLLIKRAVYVLGRSESTRLLVLAAALAFFVPVIGAVALMMAIYVIVTVEVKENTDPFDHYAPPLPFEREPARRLRPTVLANRLLFLVRSGKSMETRSRAVLQASEAPRGIRVQVLKAALADQAEEVRLLAFSQLEKIRRSIDLEIEHALEALKQGPRPKQAWKLHVILAENYHEIAYLGLAEGEIYKHVLASALTHAREALAEVPDDAAMLRLVGRILLRQSPAGEPAANAREAFDAALAAGIVRSELAVERAEEAFRRGAYDEARAALASCDDVPTDRVLVAEIQDMWR
jgi:hypothetical protein